MSYARLEDEKPKNDLPVANIAPVSGLQDLKTQALTELKIFCNLDPLTQGYVFIGNNFQDEFGALISEERCKSIQNTIFEKLEKAVLAGASFSETKALLFIANSTSIHPLFNRFLNDEDVPEYTRVIQTSDKNSAQVCQFKRDICMEKIIEFGVRLSTQRFSFFSEKSLVNVWLDNTLKYFYKLEGSLSKKDLFQMLPFGTVCRLIAEDRIQGKESSEEALTYKF